MFRIGALLFLASVIGAKVIDPSNFRGYNPFLEGRIVGGEATCIEDHPHQISLRYRWEHICGGSIYKSNIAITAAHCLGDELFFLHVAAGSTEKDLDNQVLTVKKFIKHEKFDPETLDYDIAILVLDGHFKFNDKVQPIALATTRPPSGSKVTITGWGKIYLGFRTDDLHEVEVETVSQEDCNKAYSNQITNQMICAGVDYGGKGACEGDSGGPLTYGKELLGVVSWDEHCGEKGYPGIFASVPDLHDWIVNTAKEFEE